MYHAKTGDTVRVKTAKQEFQAEVGMASPNGVSILIVFDCGLWTENGMYAGMAPLLRMENGSFETMDHFPVTIEPA